MSRSRVALLVASLVVGALFPLPVSASTITIIIIGPPPPPPPLPEDGDDVVALAANAGPENRAAATGGAGDATYYDLPAGIGGDATATAVTDVGASPALAEAIATGGRGGSGEYAGQPGVAGGNATASAVARNQSADPVTVIARATGGTGGGCCGGSNDSPAGEGGSAHLGAVYGSSTGGGEVSVFGQVTGGEGGSGWDGFNGLPLYEDGAGASATVLDAVDGSTSGALRLHQRAVGGSSSISFGGPSGDAESRLSRGTSAGSLELISEAIAGDVPLEMPNPHQPASWTSGSGAQATALGEGSNATGPVTALVLAIGGTGGVGHSEDAFRDGGDAHARAVATSQGDGNSVVVGGYNQLDYWTWHSGAWGGAGARISNSYGPAADGGDATSESIGIAHGDSSVLVNDLAVGGAAGYAPLYAQQPGTFGGSASSVASGSNQGASPVEVNALAIGGGGTTGGGDAFASATASGSGRVYATAGASGGYSEHVHPAFREIYGVGPSSHLATARGSGSEGAVEAIVANFADVQVPIRTAAVVQASLHDAVRPLSVLAESELDAFAHTQWAPLSSGVSDALAGTPVVARALDGNIDTILLMGRVGGTNHQEVVDGDSLTAVIQLHTTLPYDEDIAVGRSALAFFAPSMGGDGFGSLRVLATLGGAIFDNEVHVLIDETFDDAASAESFLAGLVLDPLGACRERCESEFNMRFEFTSEAEGAHFATGWLLGVQTIPEPSTALLVALGLAALARARARSTPVEVLRHRRWRGERSPKAPARPSPSVRSA